MDLLLRSWTFAGPIIPTGFAWETHTLRLHQQNLFYQRWRGYRRPGLSSWYWSILVVLQHFNFNVIWCYDRFCCQLFSKLLFFNFFVLFDTAFEKNSKFTFVHHSVHVWIENVHQCIDISSTYVYMYQLFFFLCT